MADDRFDDEDTMYDASHGDSPTGPVGPGGEGAPADSVAAELGAFFAAALADEPPSRVTAESVLRAVHGEKHSARRGFAEWLGSGPLSLKWAGGLVVAAALIGAVIVVAPTMRGSSSATSADSATAEMYQSAADGAAGAVPESSSASAAAAEAAPMAGELQLPASSESSAAAADSSGHAASAGGAAGDSGGGGSDGAGGAADSATTTVTAGDSAGYQSDADATSGAERDTDATSPALPGAGTPGQELATEGSSGTPCPLPPLAPAEWFAAVSALPGDVATGRLAAAICATGALRGNGIEVVRGGAESATVLWVVVSHGSIGRDAAGADSTVVSATRGDVTATVIANQGGDPWLPDAVLQQLADDVASAAG